MPGKEFGLIHEQRTPLPLGTNARRLLDSDPQLFGSLNKVSLQPGNSDEVTLLLPGLALSAENVFHKQLPIFKKRKSDILFVDYSTHTFSQPLLEAQIEDALATPQIKEKDTRVMGLSLGSKLFMDFLNNTETNPNIDKLVFLGAMTSIEDFESDLVVRGLRLATNRKFSALSKSALGVGKNLLHSDPKCKVYAAEHGEPKLTNTSLFDRVKQLANTTESKQIDTPTLLFWWEDEKVGEEGKNRVTQIFPNSKSVVIPHSHGWTATSASSINPPLESFLRS